jgi:hypothetical protein
MRHSVGNVRVKDLPLPDQRWRYQGDLVQIESISARKPDCAWVVRWTYINDEGKAIFRTSPGKEPSMVCDGSIELGRFLHKGRKVV